MVMNQVNFASYSGVTIIHAINSTLFNSIMNQKAYTTT